MEERDAQTLCPGTALPIDELQAFTFETRQRLIQTGHREGDVMNPFAPLLDVLRDRPVGCCRLKQLDLGLSDLKKSSPDLLVRNFFDGITVGPQQQAEPGDRLLKIPDRDPDMLDVRWCHGVSVKS